MFCGLLFSTGRGNGDTLPLVAQSTDYNVNVVSGIGEGSADLAYILNEDYDDLVFYVPHLIDHQGKTRQYIKLTHCSLLVRKSQTESAEEYSFQIREFVSAEYSLRLSSLPSFTELKQQYKPLLSAYTGAFSSDDVFLHLGSHTAYSQLNVRVQFLVKLDSPSSVHPITLEPSSSLSAKPMPLWQYMIHNILPTKNLKFTVNFASSLPIERVEVEPLLENGMEWSCTHNSESKLNILNMCCELQSCPMLHDRLPCSFTVFFSPGALFSCYTCVFQKEQKQLSGSVHQQTEVSTLHIDAIMMSSLTLSKDQLPLSVQHLQVFPSEVIFIIDCSGSMSGSKIQSAADMLVTCVKSLPFGCYFNVIAFGSHFRQLFHSSEKYTKYTVERAVTFANQLQATLGGTDLLPPLQWIFKKNCCRNLSRQLFIITDGGVTNTQQVLNIITNSRHNARCHTFGIGSDVCIELVTGIAAISRGRCILLNDGDRLQTKVMEVLKESLQPCLSNTMFVWNPPSGYSLVDVCPKSLDKMYVGSCYYAFAFLERNDRNDVCEESHTGSLSIYGIIGDKNVQISIKSAALFSNSSQDFNFPFIVSQNAKWKKLVDLECQAKCIPRKLTIAVQEEPHTKRPCLGDSSTYLVSSIHKQLLDYSLLCHIPSSLSYFTTVNTDKELLQVLPYDIAITNCEDNNTSHIQPKTSRRYRQRYMYRHSHNSRSSSSHQFSFSFTSFAKSTLSSVTNRIKSVVDFFLPESNTVAANDNIQMLEDEVEYQEKKDSQLRFDNSSNLMYPAFYYHQPHKGQISKWHKEIYPYDKPSPSSVLPAFSSEDNNITISDTESDSSVDPLWCDLQKPCDHLPLIHMQLFCGAWPLVKPFSYAVGVPLDDIRKLSLGDKGVQPCTSTMSRLSEDVQDEDNANFWCTVLAVTCLEQHFSHFTTEWELVAYKGRTWLQQNQHLSNMPLSEAYDIARKLVL